MGHWRAIVQPTVRVAAATTVETRYAFVTGGAKTITFTVNVYENGSNQAPKIEMYGASSLNLDDDILSNSFWINVLTVNLTALGTGAFSATLTNPPLYLRWSITGVNANVAFEIVADMWDA